MKPTLPDKQIAPNRTSLLKWPSNNIGMNFDKGPFHLFGDSCPPITAEVIHGHITKTHCKALAQPLQAALRRDFRSPSISWSRSARSDMAQFALADARRRRSKGVDLWMGKKPAFNTPWRLGFTIFVATRCVGYSSVGAKFGLRRPLGVRLGCNIAQISD